MRLGGTVSKLARKLRQTARLHSGEVEEYLQKHSADWQEIAREDPPDAADIVEEVNDETARALIRNLPDEDAADVLEETRTDVASGVIETLSPEEAAEVLAEMSAEKATDILGDVDASTREAVVGRLPPRFAAEVSRLLAFAADSAGGVMSTDLATFAPKTTSGEAIHQLRDTRETVRDLSAVYVVDAQRQLLGVVSFRDLVFAAPDTLLETLMEREPVSVRPDADREEAAQLTLRYDLASVPVIDTNGRLLGAITRPAILQTIQEEASEDIAVAAGAGKEETVFTRVRRSVRMRLPWLVANLLMALGVVFAIEGQKGVIERFAVLAALMPLVAQVGGNAGAQSLAVMIRALATDSVSPNQVVRILLRQLSIGFFNGVMVGIAAGIIGTIIGGLRIGMVVALAALVNLVAGSFAGSGVPVLLRKLGLDPALASNIFLTLVTDLVGFGGFLLIATVLL